MIAHLKSQIEHLSKCGADVIVVSSDGTEMKVFEGIERVYTFPVNIARDISPFSDLSALFRLFKLFRNKRIHIVHTTTPKAGVLAALAAWAARVPIRLHTFTGQPWVSMTGVKAWLARLSDKLIGVMNTKCYADSFGQMKYLISERIVKKGKITVLGDGSLGGVDLERFDPNRFSVEERQSIRKSLGIPFSAPVLLFVGRITRDKGVYELLRAFSEIKDQRKDLHLVLVGNFDSGSGAGGAISPDDVSNYPDTHIVDYTYEPERYYAISDILCLPSYREGFGTVVIEAAAMGVPAIGTRIYGLSDAIVDEETGLLVEARDVRALVEAIQRLLNDAELRSRMGRAAMARARVLFNAKRINKLIEEEYLHLLTCHANLS
ncbi:MAG: glycosyltransferase family 1 protein [Gammaproteobacteria bacterium]|nr:MAG: glycosyltransferase family 1 protein [Gammaproteobacteria bacterium]